MREHGGATQTVQSLGETRVNCLLKHSYEVYGTICKQTSKFHLEFSGRAPIKVLDPPVGGSYGHSTQDEDWRLQFKMWKYLQKKHYGWIPRVAFIVPACQQDWEEMENLREI